MTQRKLRPSQGGKFHAPVGPDESMVCIIRNTPEANGERMSLEALREMRRGIGDVASVPRLDRVFEFRRFNDQTMSIFIEAAEVSPKDIKPGDLFVYKRRTMTHWLQHRGGVVWKAAKEQVITYSNEGDVVAVASHMHTPSGGPWLFNPEERVLFDSKPPGKSENRTDELLGRRR